MSTTNEETPASPEPNAGVQSKENPGPIKIDPACLKDALRMYFQPIKYDDPVVDFYTMYKRETMEYDQEYMNKYNEDLNTTLIFAGLFSAVSSAFVIAFQPGLQQDPSDRSEAYLRAILLSINPSISPDEHPTTPSTWNGPPQEIVTTLDLLYASLLMSLLAAFVAMLGKQWLNRYMRHTGGSTIERCGDRQRKFDGIEKWPFRAFIGSLPVMLQIALFLLACGLSQYMWSINGSVAGVIISFTLLSFLFYVGVVIAGATSYECPFQTPASAALRALKDSRVVRKILTRISSSTSALSRITFEKAKGISQGIRRSTRTTPLPTTFDDTGGSSLTPQNSPGLRIEVRDLESIQKQNTANGRCVCWVLRNMTDPEAIDFAICLAGIIRWFDGGLDCEPPFDTIVSYFMACFDSTKQLYPGLRDRAYFSARAILQIHVRARGQPDKRARRYPIPYTRSDLLPHADNDLRDLLHIFRSIDCSDGGLELADMRINTPAHSAWVSSLFLNLFSVLPHLSLSCGNSTTTTNHPVVITNTLLMADISLGGHIEGETFWAVNKSDSLDAIFSHLSTTVIEVITSTQDYPIGLYSLLQFLTAWEKRPDSLALFAFSWCRAIPAEIPTHPDLFDNLLLTILEIGFRFISLGYRIPIKQRFYPNCATPLERIFRTASSSDDEVIADALCAWTAHMHHTSHCPLEILFDKRKGVDKPFSPRLRRVSIYTIEHLWSQIREVSEVPLKFLDVRLDEMTMSEEEWTRLIVRAVRSSSGVSLPLHHWRLLDDLLCDTSDLERFEDPCDVNMMKLLEKNGEWEKLEVWMRVIWQSPGRPVVTLVEDFERVALKLVLRRPSALLRFEGLGTGLEHPHLDRKLLELICTLAQLKPMPFVTRSLLASPRDPGTTQTTKLVEATPGSSATTQLEPTYDYEPGGSWEESGGTDNGPRGEGGQPPGSATITTNTAMSPANRAVPPSPRATGEQLVNHNSEEPRSGPTITTQPARAVPNHPPLVGDYPDNSTHHYPSLASSCIPGPHDRKQGTLEGDEPVQNNESWKTPSEREHLEEFWLGLGDQERSDLVAAGSEGFLEKLRSKHICGCGACRNREVIERGLARPYYDNHWSPVDFMNSILCMLPQPHGPQPSVGPVELDENNPMITVVSNRSDSRIGVVDLESDSGHCSEVARAESERGELPGFGHNVTLIPDHSLTAADDLPRRNRQKVLEEFVEAMADRRIIFESAVSTDSGDHSEDHSYNSSQLESELREVFSIFVPQLLSLRLLDMYQETRRVLLERQQTYRQWLQELIGGDEGVVVRE